MTTSLQAVSQLLYGLRVASDIPLYQDRPGAPDGAPDVRIVAGAPVPPSMQPPPGTVLAHLEIDQPYYTFARTETGYVLRFYGTCDFLIDPELRLATVHVADGADPGVAGILAAGALLSFILTMRERVVLHASAVQVGSTALAFVGRSGMGKSTMAALMCAAGGRLITDDVLRLDLGGGGPRCRLGATELRLRKAAGNVADQFADRPPARLTSDNRDALRTVAADHDGLPLAAIVVPRPDHEHRTVRIDRLATMDALIMLLRFPRLLGWTDAAVLDRQFRELGDVVERVPVYVARVPWGPPFDESIAPRLAAAVGIGHSVGVR